MTETVEVKGVFLHFNVCLGHPLETERRTVGKVFRQIGSSSIIHPPTFWTRAWCWSDWLKKRPICCAVTALSWHWLIQLWYSSCSGRRSQKILKASHMVSWHTVRTRGRHNSFQTKQVCRTCLAFQFFYPGPETHSPSQRTHRQLFDSSPYTLFFHIHLKLITLNRAK